MPAGDAPKGEFPIHMEPWRRENARKLRALISTVTGTGTIGGGNYPAHPPAFTPEEVANICIDQCYLESPDGAEIEIEGYVSK
jgi:hypothetical protein